MSKIFKLFFKILLALMVLALLASVGIVHFVNPNQFKKVIENTVFDRTGYILNIQGPISWRWFPILALQFEDVLLNNRGPFQGPLFSAKSVGVSCELEPLLLGKIALDIHLQDLDLTLSKNAAGQTNWATLQQRLTAPNLAPRTSKNTAKSSGADLSSRIGLNGITVENGKITLSDATKKSLYILNHVKISAEHLLKGAFGISNSFSISFQLAAQQALGTFSLESEWSLQKAGESIHFQNIAFEYKMPDAHLIRLQGSAEIQNLKQAPSLEGQLNGHALHAGNISIEALHAHFIANERLITIAPLDLKIANSQQHATIKIDLQGDTPKYVITHEAKNFEINALLALLGKKDKIAGNTNLSMRLTASGSNPEAWKKSLAGQIKLNISKGKFYGIDLLSLLKNAQRKIHTLVEALSEKLSLNTLSVINTELEAWKINARSSSYTPFDSLNASATIRAGTFNNPDLSILHSEYSLRGFGTVDLFNQNLRYQSSLVPQINLYPDNDKIARYLFQRPLSVQISGTLSDPIIRPNIKEYFEGAVQFAQTQFLEKAVEKVLSPEMLNKAFEHLLKH